MISTMSLNQNDLRDMPLLADADLCVKCGLCLPHCPTYLQTQHEGDSPRGRITLVQGLINGLVEPNDRLKAHLDGCLSCRKCEVVCPAKVPFSRVLDGGRAELLKRRPRAKGIASLMASILVSGRWRALLRILLLAYRRSGAQWAARRFGLLGRGRLARLESVLPSTMTLRSGAQSPTPVSGSAIALFEGCVTDVLERDALDGASRLLAAAGYHVQRPRDQVCCGALYQHVGQPDRAAALAQKNLLAFAGQERIATITSGCGATLRDYADLVAGGADFASSVREFSDWLLLPQARALRFKPLPLRAAFHLPCTAGNVMKSGAALRTLLNRIPQLELIELDPAQHCCGAAGAYFMTQPEMADRLLARKLDAIEKLNPDLVISSNIGCTMHLIGGLNRSGRLAPVAVRHPAVVLAQRVVLDEPPLLS